MNTQQDLNSSSSTPHIPLYEKLLKPKIVLPIILAALLAMNYEMVDNYEKLEELKGTPIPTQGVVGKIYQVRHQVHDLLKKVL